LLGGNKAKRRMARGRTIHTTPKKISHKDAFRLKPADRIGKVQSQNPSGEIVREKERILAL